MTWLPYIAIGIGFFMIVVGTLRLIRDGGNRLGNQHMHHGASFSHNDESTEESQTHGNLTRKLGSSTDV